MFVFSFQCDPGYYAPPGSTSCAPCPAGTEMTDNTAAAEADACSTVRSCFLAPSLLWIVMLRVIGVLRM
jgi:hypothetical protein